MELATVEQLEHDFEYTNREQDDIEDELVDELEELLDENKRDKIEEELRRLESDEFTDLALRVLDEI